jgi:hypothetical protein
MAIIAHLVRILDMGCIDRSSKEVLHSKRFPGDSVLGFREGLFKCLTVYYSAYASLSLLLRVA